MIKKPIFISGIGRSGTSAVLESMAEHKDVVQNPRVGEAPFVTAFLNFLVGFEGKSVNDNERNQNFEYNIKNYRLNEQHRKAAFAEFLILNQCGKSYGAEDDGDYWITKTSLVEQSFDKAIEIFGEVRCIYIMRNGIEVINSARKFAGFQDLSFAQQCRRWVDNIEVCRYLRDRPLCAIIKHDELVKDPDNVYKAVFKKLNLSYDKTPSDWIGGTLFNSSFDEKSKGKSTTKVFDGRLASAWDSWTEDEKVDFVSVCDKQMVEYGFERPYASDEKYTPLLAVGAELEAPLVLPSVKVVSTRSPNGGEYSERISAACNNSIKLNVFNYVCNLSNRYNYLFVNNAKVASTSLLKVLQTVEDRDAAGAMSSPHDRKNSPLLRLNQLTFEEQDNAVFASGMFRFTFCRDPYARLLSAYLSKIDRRLGGYEFNPARPGAVPPKAQIMRAINGGSIDSSSDFSQKIDFHSFVEVVCQLKNIDMDVHWKPQTEVLLTAEVDYNYIGRFETLGKDFQEIKRAIGIEHIESLDYSANRTNSTDRVNSYFTEDLRKMVREKYASDFEFFKYAVDLKSAVRVA